MSLSCRSPSPTRFVGSRNCRWRGWRESSGGVAAGSRGTAPGGGFEEKTLPRNLNTFNYLPAIPHMNALNMRKVSRIAHLQTTVEMHSPHAHCIRPWLLLMTDIIETVTSRSLSRSSKLPLSHKLRKQRDRLSGTKTKIRIYCCVSCFRRRVVRIYTGSCHHGWCIVTMYLRAVACKGTAASTPERSRCPYVPNSGVNQSPKREIRSRPHTWSWRTARAASDKLPKPPLGW